MTVSQYLQFLFYDLENSLNLIFNDPLRNHWLEAYVSVEKGFDIRQSVVLKLKKEAFKYNKIKILCISEGKSSIEIQGTTILFYMCTLEKGEVIPVKTLTDTIAKDMIEKIFA